MSRRVCHCLVILALAMPARWVLAQARAAGARVIVTVTDQTGAVLPAAHVLVIDPVTEKVVKDAVAAENGVATIDAVPPGRYRIDAEFSGFETGTLADVRLRSGDNRQTLALHLSRREESVTVARDAQAAAVDPRGGAFATALTPQQIEALPDDEAELIRQLQDLAGGNAVIRVDSFFGGPLPPKAMIKSIHIVRDPFAAENHSAESDEIDIITQPGVGQLRGGVSSRLRDGSMSARSPFASTKGPERTENYDGNLGGTLIKNKSSFSINVNRRHAFDTPLINVFLPSGNRSEVLNLRRPNDSWTVYGLIDYAISRDQMLRMSYEQQNTTRRNLGVGGYDLIERAYASESQDHEFHAQVSGPIGRRLFANTRVQVQWVDNDARAALEAPTVRVADAATSGGAQVRGGRHPRDIELASDIDYVRGINSVRVGVLLDAGHYRSNDESNYLGTYFFRSTDDFVAGRPATYTRRIGNPLVEYNNLQAAAYVQDDIRVRKGLTLSPGLRYEIQTHLADTNNIGPRFGINWSPFKSGHTTVRASAGVFYNWLNAGTYEQTLRIDGFRQRDITIVDPPYPDIGAAATGTISRTNRYLLGGDVQMARIFRVSAGIDQTFTPRLRASVGYNHVDSRDVLRGRNLNAPVDGVRPDPEFANVIETVSDARSGNHQLNTSFSMNFSAPSRTLGQARWNPRRGSVRVSYWIARAMNNAEGAFSVPASGTLATEWAPASGDRRHRWTASMNTQALKNLNAGVNFNANSGTAYTITTGFDDNGDTIFSNDRPAGVGRNTARTAWQSTLSANVSYTVGLGRAAGEDGRGSPRYRMVFTLSVNNLTNRPNYTGYSGVMTSPFFLRPTAVSNPRKIDLGMSLRF